MALREKIAAQQKHLKELDEHLYAFVVPIQQATLADHEIASSFRAKRAGRKTDLPPTHKAVSKTASSTLLGEGGAAMQAKCGPGFTVFNRKINSFGLHDTH